MKGGSVMFDVSFSRQRCWFSEWVGGRKRGYAGCRPAADLVEGEEHGVQVGIDL